ncbi:hypothetical protein IVB34_35800 [Bradyrhizobium sp. 2]|uniref:hypothetical protein n=1 Tax=Bradyrhizobium sp. 2 TaxID=190045 RepID=UPI001FF86244|nr:hypothetical protein [Bradyrhizobium sp. 2]MCK1463574.1 hypothetical protein [Bradyrhizobium sp. 2]
MGFFEERWSAIPDDEAAIRFARESCVISIAPDNGPFRTGSLGARRARGRIFSMKGKRSMPWEGRNDKCEEVLACETAEVETNCLQWISQPCRIEMRDGLGWSAYFPDLAKRTLRSRSWITKVAELKRKKDEIYAVEGYEEKLQLAEQHLNSIGIEFEILENRDLGTPCFRRNVHQVFLDRNTAIEPRDISLARDVAHSCAAYGELCEALGGYIVGKKKLHALMVRRILSIPLDRVITTETIVDLVDRRRDPTHPWSFFG